MASPIVVLGTTSLWPTTGDTGYSAQALQLQQLLASAVAPISGLYNTTTGHVGNLALDNSDRLTVNGVQVGGVLSFNTRTGNITLTSLDVTNALGYTPAVAGSGVTTFNTRAGAVTLTSLDVTDALGYTPGTGSGTVTSVGGTGTVSGLSLSGTVTTSGNLTLGGTLSLTSSDITTGLGFTPYNATNPAGYGTGTVTSVTGANGVSVATGTTTPVIGLGAITPSSVSPTGNLVMAPSTFIQGDFSNTTIPSRTLFQSSTVNGQTGLIAIPNGTSTSANLVAENSSGVTNSYRISMQAQSTDVNISGLVRGTGTALSMKINNNGNTAITIDTSGNVTLNKPTTFNNTLIFGGTTQQSAGTSYLNGSQLNIIPLTTTPTGGTGVQFFDSSDVNNAGVGACVLDPVSHALTFVTYRNGTGTAPTSVSFNINGTYVGGFTTTNFNTTQNISITTAGKGLQIKEGSNAKMGTSTLVAGTVTVSNTSVTANSRIFLSIASLGTVTIPTAVAVTATSVGTSFTITSANAVDTSVINWQIFEPA